MIRQIAPVFFTPDIPKTLAYYTDKLGFECLGTWQDPPVYAIVARDQHAIHFRCAAPPTPNRWRKCSRCVSIFKNFLSATSRSAAEGWLSIRLSFSLA